MTDLLFSRSAQYVDWPSMQRLPSDLGCRLPAEASCCCRSHQLVPVAFHQPLSEMSCETTKLNFCHRCSNSDVKALPWYTTDYAKLSKINFLVWKSICRTWCWCATLPDLGRTKYSPKLRCGLRNSHKLAWRSCRSCVCCRLFRDNSLTFSCWKLSKIVYKNKRNKKFNK